MVEDGPIGAAVRPGAERGRSPLAKVILALAVVAAAFVFFNVRIFYIPSSSMMPTVQTGDYILVWKMRYGWSRHSFPFGLDLFSGRIWGQEPERGDVAVFKHPRDNATDYVKRVVGLPGDTVGMRAGRLFINGSEVRREAAGSMTTLDAFGRRGRSPVYEERLGAISHAIVETSGDKGPFDDFTDVTVPAGHYFILGDNRDNSNDSRNLAEVGFVPFENLIGKVEYVLFSVNDESEAGAGGFSRFLVPVR